MVKSLILGAGVAVGLVGLAIIIGETAGEAGASVVIGVVFGVFAAVPTALAIALADRSRRNRTVHHHDNRKVIVYLQQPDGSLERLSEQQARQIAAPNGVVKITR